MEINIDIVAKPIFKRVAHSESGAGEMGGSGSVIQ